MNTFEYQTSSGAIMTVELRKGKTVRGQYQPQVYSPDLNRGWNLPIHVIETRKIKPEDIQPMTDAQFAECLAKLGLSAPAQGQQEEVASANAEVAVDEASQ